LFSDIVESKKSKLSKLSQLGQLILASL